MGRRSCVLGTALLLLVTACGDPGPVTVTQTDTGIEVELTESGELIVELESNPTTGYSWQVASAPERLELLDETFLAPDTTLVGAPGTQVFEFAATGAAAGVLRLEYVRPFDDPPIPERVVEYIVIIDDAPWPPDDVPPPVTATQTAPTLPPTTVGSPDR